VSNSRQPKIIALAAGLIAAVVSSFAVAVVTRDFVATIFNFAVVFIVCYVLFRYTLKAFIHDHIKLIYKNIYRFKTQSDKHYAVLDKNEKDPIGAVSKEVMDWMKENRKEIDQLKEQENYRREFLGNVSHELKTPIQNIQGYIHTLLDGALNDKKVNKLFLGKAAKSADRLAELVNDLTSISGLEGGSPINMAQVDMLQLTTEVFEMVESQADEKKIQLTFSKQNPKVVMVKADRAKIRQVLVNLFVNAIKYGKQKGTVRVSFFDMDQNILVEIADDGEGIEAEHLPRLFERFYRTDAGRSRDQGGTGLGLAIVKHIVEAHKQTINVRSTVGVGSTFGFTLKKG
jgi:two-component system phosphate regulon sensor histidine kinase PhoR